MFDANMRYIPKGKRFFAEVSSIAENGSLYGLGLRQGDVVFCHMLNQTPDNPMVDMLIGGRKITVSDIGCGYDWIVYAGNADGKSDFIDDKVKAKANQVLSDLITG